MYKGYEIVPMVVCFNIKYFVQGEGFGLFESYESYEDVKKAIDKYFNSNNSIKEISKEKIVDYYLKYGNTTIKKIHKSEPTELSDVINKLNEVIRKMNEINLKGE